MAVAQAQQKVKELTDLLESKNVQVKFAIHPVAGRMPGHMNVLLAEAGVSYDRLFDRDEINPEFTGTDVVLVIGANDTVNPAAHRQGSPLFGMPILDVEQAKNVIVLKRGQGKGFAGIENDLFYRDNTTDALWRCTGDRRETGAGCQKVLIDIQVRKDISIYFFTMISICFYEKNISFVHNSRHGIFCRMHIVFLQPHCCET